MKILPEIVFKFRLILLRHIYSNYLQTAIVKSIKCLILLRITLNSIRTSLHQFVQFYLILSNETEIKKQQLWNDITEQAKLKYSDPDSGRVKFVNEAICIVGLNK